LIHFLIRNGICGCCALNERSKKEDASGKSYQVLLSPASPHEMASVAAFGLAH